MMTSHKRALILVLAVGLGLLPASAAAAGANPMIVEPTAPVHRFLDGKNIGLQSVGILLMALDVASTQRALQVPGTHEANPLAQSQGALISLKVAGAGAGLGIAYFLHRTGHHRAERLVPVILGMPSGVAAVHNFGIH
jgi:hypothetical protein